MIPALLIIPLNSRLLHHPVAVHNRRTAAAAAAHVTIWYQFVELDTLVTVPVRGEKQREEGVHYKRVLRFESGQKEEGVHYKRVLRFEPGHAGRFSKSGTSSIAFMLNISLHFLLSLPTHHTPVGRQDERRRRLLCGGR
jgi:hypothetical protein